MGAFDIPSLIKDLNCLINPKLNPNLRYTRIMLKPQKHANWISKWYQNFQKKIYKLFSKGRNSISLKIKKGIQNKKF